MNGQPRWPHPAVPAAVVAVMLAVSVVVAPASPAPATTAGVPAAGFTTAAAQPSDPAGLRNGGFEAGRFEGWKRHRHTEIVSEGARTGQFAARVGSIRRTNGESSIQQTFTAPPGGRLLSLWYRVSCSGTLPGDGATARLRDDTTGEVTNILPVTCQPDSGWQQVTAPVQPGRPYTLVLASRDDHQRGTPTWTLYDDLAIVGLDIAPQFDLDGAVPGDLVTLTVTATNAGQLPHRPATVEIDLTGVLDDAAPAAGPVTDTGEVIATGERLLWRGDLPPGATASLTYPVRVQRETGDRLLHATASSGTAGGNCRPGSGDQQCSAEVPVSELVLEHRSGAGTVAAAGEVGFTTTVRNTGRLPYSSEQLVVRAERTGADAVPAGDRSASTGTLTVAENGWVWAGALPPGGEVTIAGTVRVPDRVAGGQLREGLTSTVPGSNCPPGGTDTRCVATTAIGTPELTVALTADTAAVAPGGRVGYELLVSNTGDHPYPSATVTVDLTGAVDDASYGHDAATDTGELAYAEPVLTWTGELPPGAQARTGFSMTAGAHPRGGDTSLVATASADLPGSTCRAPAAAPPCRATVAVHTPALRIEESTDVQVAGPGERVIYTITATNTGQVAHLPAAFTVDLSGVLDDADLADPVADTGTVSRDGDRLHWTGELPVGDSATVTYPVAIGDPPGGDHLLVSTIGSATPGSTCPPTGAPECRTVIPVFAAGGLPLAITASGDSAPPGAVVDYLITARNPAAAPHPGAELTVDLTDTIDDGDLTGDATADLGTVEITGDRLRWRGELPAGAEATIGFSVMVTATGTGDDRLVAAVASDAPGSNCRAGSQAPACAAVVTVSALVVAYTADVDATVPGGSVGLTVSVTNSGQTPYHDLTLRTALAGLHDDALPDGDHRASAGTLAATADGLRWTVDVPVGATVTVTGTVTARDPPAGDRLIAGRVSTGAEGGNCPPEGTDPRCAVAVPIQLPGLALTTAAEPAAAVVGAPVRYAVRVANTGEYDYPDASVVVDLGGVLDDAEYRQDAVATAGSVEFDGRRLRWHGPLPAGTTVEIDYSVMVTGGGDGLLADRVTSSAPGSACPPHAPGDGCGSLVTVLVPQLLITKSADLTQAFPGEQVRLTVNLVNRGATAHSPATFTDDLSGVLDDARYLDDAEADTGSVRRDGDTLVWTGDLPVGASATVTYTVAVSDPPTGDLTLANRVSSTTAGSNCPAGATDPACTASIDVLPPELRVSHTADAGQVVRGGTVTYTVALSNTGQAPLSLTVEGDLSGVLDNAVYQGDVVASAGTVEVDPVAAEMTWTGDLPPGGLAVVTYSVTVPRDAPAGPPAEAGAAQPDGDALVSVVTAEAPGSNCRPGAPEPDCVTQVAILQESLTIAGLTPAFTLAGDAGETVTEAEAVTMVVTTDNPTGFVVQVSAVAPALTPAGPGNPGQIPVGALEVRASDQGSFAPLSAQAAVPVHSQGFPTDPAGDPVLNDYRVAIPFVAADTYSVTLEYIVIAQ